MPICAHTRRQLLLGLSALALVACGAAANADPNSEGKRGDGKRGDGKRGDGKRGDGKRGEGKRGDGKRGEGKRGDGAELALAVATATLAPAELRRYYRTSGSLRALRSADLVATQAGIVLALLVEEGDLVKEGQRLARLDSRTFQLQASRDTVNVRNLEVELERLESLARYNAVSREELEKQRQAVASARANAKVTRHQVTMTEVIAPFAGTITRRHVDIGAMASAASPLYSLADLSQLDIDLHIPEAEAMHLEVGAPVELELLDGTRFEASVIRRAPVVDVLTGTVKFVARALTFPRGAVPGAFCRARVLVAQRAAPHTLPAAAIFDHEGLSHAYVIESGVARRRPIDVGLIGDERVEVRGGLDPDDLVVADAGAGISEGMPVRALEAAPPLPPLPPRASSSPSKKGASGGG